MSDIRNIPGEKFDEFFKIFLDAYPGIHSGSDDELKKLKENFLKRHEDKRISLWGLYRNDYTSMGLAKLSDATYLDRLNRIFASDRPICTTSF